MCVCVFVSCNATICVCVCVCEIEKMTEKGGRNVRMCVRVS